jgi:hypothetical protein
MQWATAAPHLEPASPRIFKISVLRIRQSVAEHLQPLVQALAGRQLILHAGTPKTGSTALQCWLDQHRQHLLNQGILYPSSVSDPDKPKHQWLLDGLRPGQEAMLEQQAQRLDAELNGPARSRIHTVLLSTEGLYNHFHDVVATRQQAWAHLVAHCATQLVVVFRNPLEFSLSRYRQNIINPPSCHPYHGTTHSLEELCSDPQWLKALDYSSFLEFWEDLIGRHSIHCLPYSQADATHFCRLLQIEPPHGGQQLPRRNTSVERIGVELIRAINHLNLQPEDRHQLIQHIRAAEAALPHHPHRFRHSNGSRQAVITYCRNRHGDLLARYPELTRELDCRADIGPAARATEPDVAFVCCIQPGFLEEQVVALVQSIRLFGGALRHQPVYVVSAWGEAIGTRTCLNLEALDARLIVADLNQKLRAFAYANKAYALEWLETHHPHAVHVFLDSDTLIVDEPMDLALGAEADFAARPVDLRGICSSPHDPTYRDYWETCCQLFDVELETLPVIHTTVDQQPIHANWNGGLLAMRGDRGTGQRWRLVLETLWERQLCPRPRNFWGSGQVGFAIAVQSLGLKGRILDAGYNIPLHLDPADVGIAQIEHPRHLHYHWMLEPEHRHGWQTCLTSLQLNDQVMQHLSAIPSFQARRGPELTGFTDHPASKAG